MVNVDTLRPAVKIVTQFALPEDLTILEGQPTFRMQDREMVLSGIFHDSELKTICVLVSPSVVGQITLDEPIRRGYVLVNRQATQEEIARFCSGDNPRSRNFATVQLARICGRMPGNVFHLEPYGQGATYVVIV